MECHSTYALSVRGHPQDRNTNKSLGGDLNLKVDLNPRENL
jgi:hypothetical protein